MCTVASTTAYVPLGTSTATQSNRISPAENGKSVLLDCITFATVPSIISGLNVFVK